MINVKSSVSQILEFLDAVKDEEILANSSKILRIILRDDYVSEYLITFYNNIIYIALRKGY